ncbi:MAG: hypothetical protein RL699_1414 [Bacteroidota bacterium]
MNRKLFSTKKESWWLIGFSILMSSGLIIEPQLLCGALSKGNLSGMWIFWSSLIGSAFGLSFFAHLWQKVPVQTENEFIYFRFSGQGAKYLHAFRSIYLGGLIIPFLIAFSLLGFANLAAYFLHSSTKEVLLVLCGFLCLSTYFNSLWRILRIDFWLFVLFIFLLTLLGLLLFSQIDLFSGISNKITQQKLSLFPTVGSSAFPVFLGYIFVQWWSASILDFPDMNGQKLMAAQSMKSVVKSFFLPQLVVFACKAMLFVLPFAAVLNGYTQGIPNQEVAFAALFVNTLPPWSLGLVLLFFLIPFVSFTQNNLNWGGSLLVANFYKHHVESNVSAQKENRLGKIAMLYSVLAASFIAWQFDSLLSMVKYLFAITAGVGPVFMLRWYWWRINAWTQLSAMLAGMLYPILYSIGLQHSPTFLHFIQIITQYTQLDSYMVSLLFLTLAVCSTWLVVTICTAPTDFQTAQRFVQTVQPGGFWKGFDHSQQHHSGLRIGAWLLKTASGICMYLVFWELLLQDFVAMLGYGLLYLCLFVGAYVLLSNANKRYAAGFTEIT